MDTTALALTLAGFGVLLILISYQRHRHHRDVSAVLHGASGALLILGGTVLLTLTLNFNSYDELTADQPLAELNIEQSSPQTFRVHLMRIPAGDLQVLTLKGTLWQIEARVLRWHGWPTRLGLDANIRLEKLHSADDKSSGARARNSYQLNRTPGIRLIKLQESHPEALDFLSTEILLSDPLPLQNGLRFHIYFSDGKLTARAINRPRTITVNRPPPVVSYQGVSGLETNKEAVNASDDMTDVAQTIPDSTATNP